VKYEVWQSSGQGEDRAEEMVRQNGRHCEGRAEDQLRPEPNPISGDRAELTEEHQGKLLL
jgi:hypothetical protein